MSADKPDWKELFRRIGEDHVKLATWGGDDSVEVEKLYQAFKARLLSEINFGNTVKKGKP